MNYVVVNYFLAGPVALEEVQGFVNLGLLDAILLLNFITFVVVNKKFELEVQVQIFVIFVAQQDLLDSLQVLRIEVHHVVAEGEHVYFIHLVMLIEE